MRRSVVAAVFAFSAPALAQEAESGSGPIELQTIRVLPSEQQLKQALGVSTITAEDLKRTPVVNDISEIIRRMPGANLTGTSASGQRGNQRQIELRGMGPENTLILIDGKPVLSRNSLIMGRGGERDSRGDTNWVPAEAIERIEVIRGPAAARYGSGAAGGVVNIITKRPETLTQTVGTSLSVPEDSDEGATFRTNMMIGGPLDEKFSFRLLGNFNRTGADAQDINAAASSDTQVFPPAGREGVINTDFSGLLTFDPTAEHSIDLEAGFSRQRNIFAGDSLLSPNAGNAPRLESLAGQETNSLERLTLSTSHRGTYDFGLSQSYLQWERTTNRRLAEGLAGGTEGAIASTSDYRTIVLNNLTAKSEWSFPVSLLVEQNLTLGSEIRSEWMNDPVSIQQAVLGNVQIPGVPSDPAERDPDSSSWLAGLYVENNLQITDDIVLTPGVRADYNDSLGLNLSPSLNGFYDVTDTITLKAGIARAFKAPNLFQLNPNYLLFSRGNGCPGSFGGSACYLQGNESLDPETSLNKEIGIGYTNRSGWNAGLTYFHNDYKDRIAAGLAPVAQSGTTPIFQWENVPEAVVSGLEGNLRVPVMDELTWRTNFTYMLESENKQNGQPLSLIPDYTINTWLDWQVSDEIVLTPSATHFGRTPSPTIRATTGQPLTATQQRDPYTLVNLGLTFDPKENYWISTGVKNVFDTRVYRQGSGNNAGANTFNEGGRTFYLGISATF